MESIDNLQKLLELAVQYGVLRLKTPEFEIEFRQVNPPAKLKEVEPLATTQSPIEAKPEISDEDMLFWSVEEPKSLESEKNS